MFYTRALPNIERLQVVAQEQSAELSELRTILNDAQLVVQEFTRLRGHGSNGAFETPNVRPAAEAGRHERSGMFLCISFV